jgi:glycosyltransferase involved in cell wall biosynthesis
MKIGADIRVLMDEHYSGVSEYAANLLSAILRQDKTNEYKLFYNSWHDLSGRLDHWSGPNSRVVSTAWPNKIFNYFLQKTLGYPKIDQVLGGVDIFWSPHFNFTSLDRTASGPKQIVTVHDLSFLRYPEFFSLRKNCWHKALGVKKILRSASHIVAVSRNTKNDIIELAGIAPDKVSVVYSGNNIAKRDITIDEKKEFLSRHGLWNKEGGEKAKPFILYLGNIEPRKNISGLIAAFNRLKADESVSARFPELKLVLAGAGGWKNKQIYADHKSSPYQADIIFLGYISKKDKEILYSTGMVFAYPSYYEGFGFPPLEAMTYGLPVVCSNVSSLPEVVGDAALMINPFKIEEIAAGLGSALGDEEIRARLIRKGYERAGLFSWDKAAAEYLGLFKAVYAEKNK